MEEFLRSRAIEINKIITGEAPHERVLDVMVMGLRSLVAACQRNWPDEIEEYNKNLKEKQNNERKQTTCSAR